MTDFEDRLIDTLLAEEIGDQPCPDLTDRILNHLEGPSAANPWLMRMGMAAGIAAALGLLITLTSLLFRTNDPDPTPLGPVVQQQPAPPVSPIAQLTGDYRVVGGGEPARGSVIQTSTGSASMKLGGFIHTTLAPHTSIRLGGDDKNEVVYLARGGMHCKVDKHVGKFTIQTEVGSVTVLGTEFEVNFEGPGETPMNKKQLLVSVLSGAVLLSTDLGEQVVKANEEATTGGRHITVVAQADRERERRPEARPERKREGDHTIGWYKERLRALERELHAARQENSELRLALKRRGDPAHARRKEGDGEGRIKIHVKDGDGDGDGVARKLPRADHKPGLDSKGKPERHEDAPKLSLKERLQLAVAKHKADQEAKEKGEVKPEAKRPHNTTRTAIAGLTKGFAGYVRGTVVRKASGGILIRVESVKAWDRNHASSPKSLVGKNIGFVVPKGEGQGHFLEIIRELKVGDAVTAGGIHRSGGDLTLAEALRKNHGGDGDKRPERRKEGDRKD
jgi:hypothetical protein